MSQFTLGEPEQDLKQELEAETKEEHGFLVLSLAHV